ncbi:hypothetical protein DFJ74DRAFT_649853 [Hyaloraphidium curvatum]|nr:hypothetical protein DFJ74DRAFT_649853 [Hyaloraphidium curvatum]
MAAPGITVQGNGPIIGGNASMAQIAAQLRAAGLGGRGPAAPSGFPGRWADFNTQGFAAAYDASVFQYMAEVAQRQEAKGPNGEDADDGDAEPVDPKPLAEALGLLEALLTPEEAESRELLKPFFPEGAKLPEKPLKKEHLVQILGPLFDMNVRAFRILITDVVGGPYGSWNRATIKDIPPDGPPFHPILYHHINRMDPRKFAPAMIATMHLAIFARVLKSARIKMSLDFEILDILCVMASNSPAILQCVASLPPDSDAMNLMASAPEEMVEYVARDLFHILNLMQLFLLQNFTPYKTHFTRQRDQDPFPKKDGEGEGADAEKKEAKDGEGDEKKEADESKAAEGDAEEREGDKKKRSIGHFDYLLHEAERLAADIKARSETLAAGSRSRVEGAVLQFRLAMLDDESWAKLKKDADAEERKGFASLELAMKRGRGERDPALCDDCGQNAPEGKQWKHCARCKSVWYCSVECQRIAWATEHKKECAELAKKSGGQEESGEKGDAAEEAEAPVESA